MEITWTTYERSFIQAFGPRLDEVVSEEFARRGIAGQTGFAVRQVDEREVRYEKGESIGYDLLVTFPPYVTPSAYPGLASDERGFLRTELETRRVLFGSLALSPRPPLPFGSLLVRDERRLGRDVPALCESARPR